MFVLLHRPLRSVSTLHFCLKFINRKNVFFPFIRTNSSGPDAVKQTQTIILQAACFTANISYFKPKVIYPIHQLFIPIF